MHVISVMISFRPLSPPARPRKRFLPYRWRFRVRETAVRRTLKPLLAVAGFLGAGGGLLSFRWWYRIHPVLEAAGVEDWLRSEAVLLLYTAILATVAFLLLGMIAMRLLDGVWMFSLGRNTLLVAVLNVLVLLLRLLPETAFLGFLFVALVVAILVSYTYFGPWGEHLAYRAYGDASFEILMILPFLALLWPSLWATRHVRLAWEVGRTVWVGIVS